jgi:hypothetical protein
MRYDHPAALATANLLPQLHNLDRPENKLPATFAHIGRRIVGVGIGH